MPPPLVEKVTQSPWEVPSGLAATRDQDATADGHEGDCDSAEEQPVGTGVGKWLVGGWGGCLGGSSFDRDGCVASTAGGGCPWSGIGGVVRVAAEAVVTGAVVVVLGEVEGAVLDSDDLPARGGLAVTVALKGQ